MIYVNRTFVFLFILMVVFIPALSGCAVSGSGNPVSSNKLGSNNEIGPLHGGQNVTVEYPESRVIQPIKRFKRSKVNSKCGEYI